MLILVPVLCALFLASCGQEERAKKPDDVVNAAEKEEKEKPKNPSVNANVTPPGSPIKAPKPVNKLPDYNLGGGEGKGGINNQDGDNYCKHEPTGPTGIICDTGLEAPCNVGEIVCEDRHSSCVNVIASCGLQTFLAARPFSAGQEAIAFASGDFNGDTIPDAAVINQTVNTISILLGLGNGEFQSPSTVPLSFNPRDIATADLDGDLDLDLVIVHPAEDGTTVCLGNGAGAFVCNAGPATGDNPVALALGEFSNTDGIDLAVVNYGANSVSVYQGNNNGTFQMPNNFAVGSGPVAIDSGALANSSARDLVVVNALGDSISVLIDNNGGSYLPAVTYPVGNYPSAVELADLDNDGDLDVAVANVDSDDVTILFNDGFGVLSLLSEFHILSATYDVCPNPTAITSADIDGNSYIDLLLSCDDRISILFNENGVFEEQQYTTGKAASDISVEDVNGDSYPDVLVSAFDGEIIVFLGSVDGTLSAVTSDFNCLSARGLALGDVDQDGDLDVAIGCPGEGNVKVRLNNGDGTYGTSAAYLATGEAVNVALADLNNDTYVDLILLLKVSNELRIVFNNQDGTFSGPVNYTLTLATPQSLTVTDIGGDGDLDIVVTNLSDESVSLFFNNGLGVFSTILNDVSAASNPYDVAAGNFDGAFGMDLAIPYRGSDLIEVRLSGGENLLYPTKVLYPLAVGSLPSSVAVGDVNGDGWADIAIAESGTDKISFALNNPMSPGSFSISPTQFDVGDNPLSVILVDVNADGNLDVVSANEDDASISVITLDGALNVLENQKYIVGGGPYEVVAGRLDDDFDLDLITSLGFQDGMSIILNLSE